MFETDGGRKSTIELIADEVAVSLRSPRFRPVRDEPRSTGETAQSLVAGRQRARAMTSDGSDTPLPEQPDGALDLLRDIGDAACAALEDAAHLGQDVRFRQAQLSAVEAHLDEAARLVEQSRQELTSVAAEIIRASLPGDACGAPWAACARCLGTGLTASAGKSWCPSCGRSGGAAAARSTYLCTERATVTMRDSTGAEAAMCVSHAAGAARDIAGLTVIKAHDDDIRALILNARRPIRVDTTATGRHLGLVTRER